MLLKDKRIFIVEDNSLNRVVFQMTLPAQGATVEFERSGRDAIRRLQEIPRVDVIILDLMLHWGISGYDIFEEIRKLHEFDGIPVVAVSASEPAIAIPKTQVMGFAGFIGKPIDDDIFAEQISRILAGESIWYAGMKTWETKV